MEIFYDLLCLIIFKIKSICRSAGLCSFEGKGKFCSIRLSKPLLQYRPRKDLVETLLHEMIHAYLFLSDGVK